MHREHAIVNLQLSDFCVVSHVAADLADSLHRHAWQACEVGACRCVCVHSYKAAAVSKRLRQQPFHKASTCVRAMANTACATWCCTVLAVSTAHVPTRASHERAGIQGY